ncbi:MAG: SPOR domain-containing protein [Mariniphaga sp.]|nr:SPOR domain-containing protein [Mariniphaga sp.]
MKKNKAYFNLRYSRNMLVNSKKYLIILVCLLFILLCQKSFAQENPDFDEISVYLDVQSVGVGEIDAVIKGTEIYLPVTFLFDFLKIRNIPSLGLDTIRGFFIIQEKTYLIDRITNRIFFNEKIYDLEPNSLIRTETNLYLKGDYFGEIFGLDCSFNFRNLSVKIKTRLELPIIREMRQKEMRKNISSLIGKIVADTTIGRNYPLFHFGMADWSAIATKQIQGLTDTRLNLTLGSIIAGGETMISLNYNSNVPFTEKQQYYLWRYVNNDNSILRQVKAGKIVSNATSSIYEPVVGVQATNTPTTFRRSFGTYTLSDKTEPDWIVELYVNNILVDYVKADASGFFTFEVPLVYGNSFVKLKFYGPWGEERIRERNIIIPFEFLPRKTFEYTVSAGMVEDTLYSRFSKTSFNYGLTNGLTIGAGFEYLSSVTSNPMMPYVNASVKLASNFLFSAEYTHYVRTKGTLTYRLPSGLQIDLNYIKYAKDQKAIRYNYLEERKASISIPIRLYNFSAYNRLTVNQLILPTTNYTTSQWLISGSLFGINTNISTSALFVGNLRPYVYSNLSLSFRFSKGLTIRQQAQYAYSDKKLLSIKTGLEKRIMQKGFLNLSFEQNFRSNLRMGEIGFRYDFNFAQAGFSTRQSDNNTTFIQYARGSIKNNSKTNYLRTGNRSTVGRGGITFRPFLDLNANDKRDIGEPGVYGLNLHANTGVIERNEKDTTIRILDLEPYTNCFIEFDQNSFDNIAWRMKNQTMSITVNPNMLKLIEIPIIVVGEASGVVMFERDGEKTGLARMIVNFYSKYQKRVGRTLTEEDGYFSYFGLIPGSFTARIDTIQLQRLGMTTSPDSINFDIMENIEGDYIDGLDFLVKMKVQEPAIASDKKDSIKETANIIISEDKKEGVKSITGSYAIQLGAFKYRINAEALKKELNVDLGNKIEIFAEDGFYKVRITRIKTSKEIDDFTLFLNKKGINEIRIIAIDEIDFIDKIKIQESVITSEIKAVVKDTADITIFKDIEEDEISETESYEIQPGAFKYKANADALREKLAVDLVNNIEIFNEDGLYKVRITGVKTRKEIDDFIPVFRKNNVNDIRVITVESLDLKVKMKDIEPVITPETKVYINDSTSMIITEVIVGDISSVTEGYAIQLGAFKYKVNANELMGKLAANLINNVEIFAEDGLYKVRITGIGTRKEIDDFIPTLKKNDVDEIRVIIIKRM